MSTVQSVAITGTYRVVTMVVYLCLIQSQEGEWEQYQSEPVPAPDGRNEREVDFEGDDAYGFYFVDRVELIVEEGQHKGTYVLETKDGDGFPIELNRGPTFYRQDRCAFGTAEDFFREHPEDAFLAQYVTQPAGEEMARVTVSDDEGVEVYRYYVELGPEDALLAESEEDEWEGDDPVGLRLTGWSKRPVVGSA